MKTRISKYPLCRYTKTNGLLCQSPAIGPSAYCHFHKKLGRTQVSYVGSGPGLTENLLYPLRNAQSVQQALSMVLSGLMSGRLPTAQAGKMLYALEIASKNLRNP